MDFGYIGFRREINNMRKDLIVAIESAINNKSNMILALEQDNNGITTSFIPESYELNDDNITIFAGVTVVVLDTNQIENGPDENEFSFVSGNSIATLTIYC